MSQIFKKNYKVTRGPVLVVLGKISWGSKNKKRKHANVKQQCRGIKTKKPVCLDLKQVATLAAKASDSHVIS